MPPPPQNRPSTFVVTANNDPNDAAYELTRERSVLQPGEVRTPAVRPTPLIGDWARNDSSTWEFKEADGHPGCTPLNSYGGKDDLWSVPGGAGGVGGNDGHDDDDDAETAMVQSTIQQALAAATHDSQHNHSASQPQDAYHPNNFPHQYHQHHQQQQHHHHHDGGAAGGGGFQVDDYAAGHHHAAFSNSAPHAALLSQGMLATIPNISGSGGSMRPASMSAGKFTRFTVQHSTMPSSGSIPMPPMMPIPPPLAPSAGGVPLASGSSQGALTPELGSRQSSSDAASLLAKFRSQSEILSDELYFQAKSFPPPPSPNPPAETRRIRAELWYLVARKWDITQQMPPPPRSPLPGMEEEHRLKLQELTRVPYRGDRWLAQSDRWFHWVQEHFEYPPENTPVILSPQFVMSMCA